MCGYELSIIFIGLVLIAVVDDGFVFASIIVIFMFFTRFCHFPSCEMGCLSYWSLTEN